MYEYLGNYPSDREPGWSNSLQGVTNDGENWFFAQQHRLWKFPLSHDLNGSVSVSNPGTGIISTEIPSFLKSQGYDHYGDLDFYQGYLFVPLEQMKGNIPSKIVVFEAASLSFVTCSNLIYPKICGWCAIDPSTGFLYSSDFLDVNSLFVYRQEINGNKLYLEYKFSLTLFDENMQQITIQHVQGGVFSRKTGLLYLVSDAGEDDGGIMIFDVRTGKIVTHIKVNYDPKNWLGWTNEELEGITIWDLDTIEAPNIKGQLHLIMIDHRGTGDPDLYFKHFRVAERVTNLL